MSSIDQPCPVCLLPAILRDFGVDCVSLKCPACGTHIVSNTVIMMLPSKLPTERHRAVLRHALRKRSGGAAKDVVTSYLLDLLLVDPRLPGVKEQTDTLVRIVGDKQRNADVGKSIKIPNDEAVASIGAMSIDGIRFIVEELTSRKLLQPRNPEHYALTFDGWEMYEQLQRQHNEGPIAFMAMKFGDQSVDHAYRNCFKPAAKRAGFELRTLNEGQTAGLIDNRMRVELRKSRFVVADLTYANSGAYWEAGYAEGIGRPVIYTCEKSWFSEKKTHFDTNHCLTIRWDAEDLPAAQNELADCIRATLPTEARLSD